MRVLYCLKYFMGLYYNIYVLEPLDDELCTKINKSALKTTLFY
jgi:hypothetical protein